MGMAEKAANFFLKSPKLELHQQAVAGVGSHAADFLVDMATGLVRNDNNERLDSLVLAENYKKSSLHAAFRSSSRYLDKNKGAEEEDRGDEDGDEERGKAKGPNGSGSSGSSVSSNIDTNNPVRSDVAMSRVATGSSGGGLSVTSTSTGAGSGHGSSKGSLYQEAQTQQPQQQFASKYVATPTSEASASASLSSVISPYRPRSASRFQSHSASATIDSEDQTTMTGDSSSTPLQALCSHFISLGDLCCYSLAMCAAVGKEAGSVCHSLTQVDFLLVGYKARVLWGRNFRMLVKREQLVVQTTVTGREVI